MSSDRKRSKACVRCRHQKIRCVTNAGAEACQKCSDAGVECVFGGPRKDDYQWKKEADLRLMKLDDNIQEIFTILKQMNPGLTTTASPITSPSQEVLTKFNFFIAANDEAKCLTFFQDSLSKYLPIFIFDYIPRITRDIQDTSPLLYLAILSVASLYLDECNQYFKLFIENLQSAVSTLSPSKIFDTDGTPFNFEKTLYDLLGCIITSAWLGNDLGAKCSLIASDLAGRLNPPALERINLPVERKKAAFAFNLASYIIERRLQISYTNSEYINIRNYMAKRRDYFLPHYLNEIFTPNETNSKVYKLRANIELCTIIMIFHENLSNHANNLNDDKILQWSMRLNQWLADWIGKLFTTLETSSAKPVLLTYHFAKMFLYIQALNSTIPTVDINNTLSKAENTALDIIGMLLLDKDIRRLIKIGPVFYPTIFVTATALLLKIISIGTKYNYKINEKYLISKAEESYNILCQCITSPYLPSFVSIQALGEGIRKVKTHLQPTEPTTNNPIDISPLEGITYNNVSGPDLAELMNGFLPVANHSPVDETSVNMVNDYSRLWTTEIFDPTTFEPDAFTSEFMKSLNESPMNKQS